MEAMGAGLVVLVLFAGVVALMPFAYAGWRRLTAREGDLQIWQVMRRVGLGVDDAAGREPMLARAVRRCVMCPSIDDCDRWLASEKRDGLDLFCPNATYFAGLETQKDQRAKR